MDRRVTFRKWYWLIAVVIFAYLSFLALYHWDQLGIPTIRIPIIMISFVWLVLTLSVAHFNKPYRSKPGKHGVAVIVPNHNEDPGMFRQMLESVAKQTYPPHVLYIVENGASDGRCREVFDYWAATQTTIAHAVMAYNAKPSKRNAQYVALRSPEVEMCDIITTIDGDTELAPDAIENGLRPFRDPDITAVAGLLIGKNRAHNLLSKVIDLGFVSSFMNGRASWSVLNSVAVNCGGLAFYRAWAIRLHLEHYVNQTVCGAKVNTGDDRMFTGYAALHGKTVFQETSVAYTLLPVNLSHLTRQRGRWWRSWWWGGLWLIRSFSPRRAIWWLVASQIVNFTLYALMIPLILVVDPIHTHHFPWEFFLYVFGLSYIRMARTLKVRRPDQSTVNQLLTYLLCSPLVSLLNIWICAVLQVWGLLTFKETGWKTRQKIEVAAD